MNAKCNRCGGQNHFASVCKKATKRSKGLVAPVRRRGNGDEREKEKWQRFKKRVYREVIILGERLEFQIDSGADISIKETIS